MFRAEVRSVQAGFPERRRRRAVERQRPLNLIGIFFLRRANPETPEDQRGKRCSFWIPFGLLSRMKVLAHWQVPADSLETFLS